MKTVSNFVHGPVMLRPTTAADLNFVLAAERHRDNTVFIRQWSIDRHLEALEDPNIGHFIVNSVSECKPVGYVILVGLEDSDLSLELRRIVIAKKGYGYGRQAMRMLKAYTFEELTFHRLWLDVMLHNSRASKLYKSEGFTVEGVHREAVRQGARFVDVKVMAVLRGEYFERLYNRPTRLLTDSFCTEESERAIVK